MKRIPFPVLPKPSVPDAGLAVLAALAALGLFFATPSGSRAASVVATSDDPAMASVGGETAAFPGSQARFPDPGNNKYESVETSGASQAVKVSGEWNDTDFMVEIPLPNLDIKVQRYVEIHYTLDVDGGANAVGGHGFYLRFGPGSLALQPLDKPQGFPKTSGRHRVILDMLGGNTEIAEGTEAQWDLLRWDFWNAPAKANPVVFTLTLHKIVIGSELKEAGAAPGAKGPKPEKGPKRAKPAH
jgi:hypothetical protein